MREDVPFTFGSTPSFVGGEPHTRLDRIEYIVSSAVGYAVLVGALAAAIIFIF